jgi:amino-acid N-acetyltransferase
MITYTFSKKEDTEAIIQLLKANNLPVSDLKTSGVEFLVAKNGPETVGCIGIERFGTHGLLRSFAVDTNYRNRGIGNELFSRLLNYAAESGIQTLHLLTNTASGYFSKKGFITGNRGQTPETIRNTVEFSSLCPVTSDYMILEPIPHYAE